MPRKRFTYFQSSSFESVGVRVAIKHAALKLFDPAFAVIAQQAIPAVEQLILRTGGGFGENLKTKMNSKTVSSNTRPTYSSTPSISDSFKG